MWGSSRTLVAIVAVLVMGATAAQAQDETNVAGINAGTITVSVDEPNDPFTSEATAAFAGLWAGAPAGGTYACTASGESNGPLPFGGPASGTFECLSDNATGMPASIAGPLAAWGGPQGLSLLGTVEPTGETLSCFGPIVPTAVDDAGNPTMFVTALVCTISGSAA